MSQVVYVGPYVAIAAGTRKKQYKKAVCPNDRCNYRPAATPFCGMCGSQVTLIDHEISVENKSRDITGYDNLVLHAPNQIFTVERLCVLLPCRYFDFGFVVNAGDRTVDYSSRISNDQCDKLRRKTKESLHSLRDKYGANNVEVRWGTVVFDNDYVTEIDE